MRRVLIVHPEAETRSAIDAALRQTGTRAPVVDHAVSLAEGLRRASVAPPHVVFVDVGGDRSLVVSTVRGLRATGRLVIGIYNPLLLRDDVAFLRDLTRAGVGDFIALPVSAAEVVAALARNEDGEDAPVAEGQVIAFFSQQGGVGTTTLAVNTALLMAGADVIEGEVALLDAAVQFGSAAAFLGLTPQRDLSDFVRDPQGEASLAACLTEEPLTGLKVLAAPRDPVDGDRITPEDMTRVLIELRRRFAWVVVDTPPVLDLLTLAVLDSAEKVFIVTEGTTPIMLGTAKLLSVLATERFGADRLRLVLNRHSSFEGNLTEQTVAERLGRRIDHVVPYNRAFLLASNRGKPLITVKPSAAVQAALTGIAEDAINPTEPAE